MRACTLYLDHGEASEGELAHLFELAGLYEEALPHARAALDDRRAALLTLGVILSDLACSGRADDPLVTRVFGLLLTGVAHYDNTIHQTALSVLCCDVLSGTRLPLDIRRG